MNTPRALNPQGHLHLLHSWYANNRSAYMDAAQRYLGVMEAKTRGAAALGLPASRAAEGATAAVKSAFDKAMELIAASSAMERRASAPAAVAAALPPLSAAASAAAAFALGALGPLPYAAALAAVGHELAVPACSQ